MGVRLNLGIGNAPSCMNENLQLDIYLSSIGVHPDKPSSPSLTTGSSSAEVTVGCHHIIVDPALAFIKAYRLRGDVVGLKQAVLSVFDCTSLATAYKSLWDNYEDNLSFCGLTFYQRRTCEKRQAADTFLADIIIAFDKLDTSDKLLAILCEANNLIKLPCLAPDPISVKLAIDSQTNTLNYLADKIQRLPSLTPPPSDAIDKSCSALDKVVGDLKEQLSKFSSSI